MLSVLLVFNLPWVFVRLPQALWMKFWHGVNLCRAQFILVWVGSNFFFFFLTCLAPFSLAQAFGQGFGDIAEIYIPLWIISL